MKTFIIILSLVVSFFSFSQVGINNTNPNATLDINGNLSIRSVTTTSGTDVLTIDANNTVAKKYAPLTYVVGNIEIPRCNNVSTGSTGSFNTVVNVTYTMDWTILNKVTATTSTTAFQKPSKLHVQYDISPPLPFIPDGLTLTAYNKSNYPDTFCVN